MENKKKEVTMKKVEKEGLKLPTKCSELTTAQKEILHLLTDEFLTIKQIAYRRNCSIQAVYKIIAQMKEKGIYDGGLNKVEKVESTYNKTDVRLHGQEFNIKIILQNNKYQERLIKSNILFLDSNTIRLYKNSVEVYSGQSFFGKDNNEADKKGFEYWRRFFARLEHELNITLVKQRSRNILEVNHHYARGSSEVYENARENKERIWIYAEEDGKLCFLTDDSFGFKEDETVHPITAKPDRQAIDKQVNDWRLNNPPTNSEIAKIQLESSQGLKIMSETMNYAIKDLPIVLNGLKEQISSHLKLIQDYRKENVLWRKKTIKDIKNELINGKQLKLRDFT